MRKRVLIVYKKSSYEANALDKKDRNYLRLLKERNVAILRSKATHDIHIRSLERVKQSLKNIKIPFDIQERFQPIPSGKYSLVVTVGGDGTFLETSHYLKADEVLMGINSVPEESVGFFCHSTAGNFLKKMELFFQKRLRTRILHRLQISIDGKKVGPPILNDLLFTSLNPAGTTRYLLKIGKTREEQKSSGIWVSPAPGSTAATLSAGGRRLSPTSRKLQYVVREPYEPKKPYRLIRKVFNPDQRLEIISMMDEAAACIDGPHLVYPVRRGSRIVIQNAKLPIRVI